MRLVAILATTLVVSSCITSEEMQVAPNVVQINTMATGNLFVGHAGDVTMQTAAKATLANGDSLFKDQNAQMGGGQQLVGVQTCGSVSVAGSPAAATAI